ncbi:MAG: glutathione S-transferase family protein [Halobacteriovoraceae bacterium]|nr:glutathione S-transferase family protein [Halobacteriovoraceae bacterium]
MLNIYGMGGTRSMRAVWAAKETGLEFEYVEVDLKGGEHKGDEFSKLNPNGAIPVLKHNDFVLWESAAIVTYLGDLVPDMNLTPKAGTRDRGRYDQWLHFTNCELDAYLFNIEKHIWRYDEADRNPAIVELTIKDLQGPLKIIEKHLSENKYVMGEEFSMVDIPLAHCLNWARFRKAFESNEILDTYTKELSKREKYPRELYKK